MARFVVSSGAATLWRGLGWGAGEGRGSIHISFINHSSKTVCAGPTQSIKMADVNASSLWPLVVLVLNFVKQGKVPPPDVIKPLVSKVRRVLPYH